MSWKHRKRKSLFGMVYRGWESSRVNKGRMRGREGIWNGIEKMWESERGRENEEGKGEIRNAENRWHSNILGIVLFHIEYFKNRSNSKRKNTEKKNSNSILLFCFVFSVRQKRQKEKSWGKRGGRKKGNKNRQRAMMPVESTKFTISSSPLLKNPQFPKCIKRSVKQKRSRGSGEEGRKRKKGTNSSKRENCANSHSVKERNWKNGQKNKERKAKKGEREREREREQFKQFNVVNKRVKRGLGRVRRVCLCFGCFASFFSFSFLPTKNVVLFYYSSTELKYRIVNSVLILVFFLNHSFQLFCLEFEEEEEEEEEKLRESKQKTSGELKTKNCSTQRILKNLLIAYWGRKLKKSKRRRQKRTKQSDKKENISIHGKNKLSDSILQPFYQQFLASSLLWSLNFYYPKSCIFICCCFQFTFTLFSAENTTQKSNQNENVFLSVKTFILICFTWKL